MNMRDHSKKSNKTLCMIEKSKDIHSMYNISDFYWILGLKSSISDKLTLLEISTEKNLLDYWLFRSNKKKQKILPDLFKRPNITL